MKKILLFVFVLIIVLFAMIPFALPVDSNGKTILINKKMNGYRGIWYFNQKLDNEYVYKYSGGLGTYCAKHQPFAVYSPEANKTFFCYGGRYEDKNTLVHMVSYFDHETGKVPRPTLLLDKKTDDAHDNPVISLDEAGYIWIFSSSHGTSRPSYISRSREPYDINEFELVSTTNFSYPQPWFVKESGFFFFHTKYGFVEGCDRTLCFINSPDGVAWSNPKAIAAIERGHYQVSSVSGKKAGTAFNMHPRPEGLNWRTNLYYLETRDFGGTWQTVGGKKIEIPVTRAESLSLAYDAEGLNVYLKDLQFDGDGNPVILALTSRGFESGPGNDPRNWIIVRWTGDAWTVSEAFQSDNNYDMGSLYLDGRSWTVIAPSGRGTQPYNPGGEVQMWESRDKGATWTKTRDMTRNSPRNHTYIRRPLHAHPDFYALWADGHGRQPSESILYYSSSDGEVFRLPVRMEGDSERPEQVFHLK